MPSPALNLETLAAFASGELSAREAAAVEEALRRDQAAQASVHRMRVAIAAMRSDDSSEPSIEAIGRAKSAVARVVDVARRNETVGNTMRPWWHGWHGVVEALARLVYDSRSHPEMAAGFRGGAETRQMTFVASEGRDEVELDLQIGPPAASGAADAGVGQHDPKLIGERCRVIGQLSPVVGDAPVCSDRKVVALRSGTDDAVAHAATDRNGVFSMSLPPGRYDFACAIEGVDDTTVAVTIRGIDVP